MYSRVSHSGLSNNSKQTLPQLSLTVSPHSTVGLINTDSLMHWGVMQLDCHAINVINDAELNRLVPCCRVKTRTSWTYISSKKDGRECNGGKIRHRHVVIHTSQVYATV